jgi:hypothetical protein
MERNLAYDLNTIKLYPDIVISYFFNTTIHKTFGWRGLSLIVKELLKVKILQIGTNPLYIIGQYARGMIISLDAEHGSGKTTVADILVNKYNFVKLSFALPMKNMLNTYNTIPEVFQTDADKKIPNRVFNNLNARNIMQIIGQDMQELPLRLDKNKANGLSYIWSRFVDSYICRNPMNNYIVDDAYLNHWIYTLKYHGSIHIKIIRNNNTNKNCNSSHITQDISKKNKYIIDDVIENNGTLEDLNLAVSKLLL